MNDEDKNKLISLVGQPIPISCVRSNYVKELSDLGFTSEQIINVVKEMIYSNQLP